MIKIIVINTPISIFIFHSILLMLVIRKQIRYNLAIFVYILLHNIGKNVVRLDDGLAKIFVMKQCREKTFSKKGAFNQLEIALMQNFFKLCNLFRFFGQENRSQTPKNPQVSFLIPLSRFINLRPFNVEISGPIFQACPPSILLRFSQGSIPESLVKKIQN